MMQAHISLIIVESRLNSCCDRIIPLPFFDLMIKEITEVATLLHRRCIITLLLRLRHIWIQFQLIVNRGSEIRNGLDFALCRLIYNVLCIRGFIVDKR